MTLVLLGDPQQLEQPMKGVHPEATGASALDHVLGGKPTIGEDEGLFLDETWRLHPEICRFTSELFYEGRLHSRPGLDIQTVGSSSRSALQDRCHLQMATECIRLDSCECCTVNSVDGGEGKNTMGGGGCSGFPADDVRRQDVDFSRSGLRRSIVQLSSSTIRAAVACCKFQNEFSGASGIDAMRADCSPGASSPKAATPYDVGGGNAFECL